MDVPTEADRIKSLVRGLPLTQRTVVMLFYADGLTSREIAEVLEISHGRVDGILTAFRARAAAVMARRLAA